MKKTTLTLLFLLFAIFSTYAESQVLNPPELRISLQKKLENVQTQSVEKTADGTTLLRIENKSAKDFCEFSILGGMPLSGFDVLELTVNLDRSRTSALRNFSIRLKDATGEVLQYTLVGKQLPDGDTLFYKLDRNQKPLASWGGNQDGEIDQPAQLIGGAFRFEDGEGTLYLRGFSARTVVPYAVVPRVELQMNQSGFAFFQPGQESGVLFVHNANSFPIEAKLAYRIVNANEGESTKAQEISVALGANESKKIPFDIPAKFGLYELKSTVSFKGRPEGGVERDFRFASMIPATPGERVGGEFLFGICCQHLPKISSEHMEKEIVASMLCGAQIVRFCSYWDMMEPKPGQWDFAPVDRVFRLMEQNKLKSQVLHSRLPNWAAAADWKSIRESKQEKKGMPLPDFDAWRNFVRTYATRYSGRGLYTEIWNEPDLLGFADFSTEEYLKLLKIAAEEIRANDPETLILTGGFATIPSPGWMGGNSEIAERTMSEGKGDYDVFALHNHTILPPLITVLNRFEEMRKRNGDKKKWYMNESGLTTRNASEWEQAATLFRKLLYSWSRGAVAFNWYNLRNDGWDKGNGEHNFGLLLNDYQPKQSYVTYNMLTTLYSGGTFVRTLNEGGEYTSLLFRDRKGDYLVANFLNRSNERSRTVALSGVNGRVERIDLFGNSRELSVKNGILFFELTPEPHTLKITGDQPKWGGEVIRIAENPGLYRGRDNRFVVEVSNPGDTEQICSFRVNAAKTLRVRFEVDSLRIPARSSQKLVLYIHPATEHDSAAAGEILVMLGKLGEVSLALPQEYNRVLQQGDFAKEPDFVLNHQDQLSVQLPSAPEYESMVWKGPEDLSARVFLAATKDELRLRVEVTDDLHVQKYRNDGLWQGDSVQFVVASVGVNGFWRFGLSLNPDGEPESYLWDAPVGKSKDRMLGATRLKATRNDAAQQTVYEFAMPVDQLEINERAFRFNLLVNDNDGTMRESFIEAAPGLGRSFDVRNYPLYKKEKK